MNNTAGLHTLKNAKNTGVVQGTVVDKFNKKKDNSCGGEPPMDKTRYVTHEELELSNEKLLHHIDIKFAEIQNQMNTKFNEIDKKIDLTNEKINTKVENQKVWFYGTGIAIVSITCTIIGLLIKFIK